MTNCVKFVFFCFSTFSLYLFSPQLGYVNHAVFGSLVLMWWSWTMMCSVVIHTDLR